MHSSAAQSTSIVPAATCTCTRTAGCATCSAPSRAATAVEVCDVETSRTSSAGPNAPSTSPRRSVFVQHGRPAQYRWQRALPKTYIWSRDQARRMPRAEGMLTVCTSKQFRSRFLGRKCNRFQLPAAFPTSPAGHRPHRGPLGSLLFRWGHDWYGTPS